MMEQEGTFGSWLRRRRKARDLTQAGLGDLVGCSVAAIRKIEAGERRPSLQIANLIADVFSIPPDDRDDFLRFARQEKSMEPRVADTPRHWRQANIPIRSNLPAPPNSFIGHSAELVLLQNYLADQAVRLVTLVGPPGIGKTRLSLEAARQALPTFPDGVFFVALAPLDQASRIVPAILQALDFSEPRKLKADDALQQGIGEQHILIVLDNCEHLIHDIALAITQLLSACSKLKILTTSREALRVPGEWLVNVPALQIPKAPAAIDPQSAAEHSALALFVERARAVKADFVLDNNNLPVVTAICEQLDGLPLAIELIAARMRLMPPSALLKRLTDQYVLSADGMRAVSARQKTLNNAIGWSYDLLSAEEQKVFARLSVFSGGFTLEAAELVGSTGGQDSPMVNIVTSLLEKNLLQHTVDTAGEFRYHMLATIRHYATSVVRRSGAEEETRNRHLSFYLHLALQGEAELHGPDQVEWGDRLEIELGNFHTALGWAVNTAQTEPALRMLCALGWAWEVRAHLREAFDWFDKVRRLPDVTAYPLLYTRLLNHLGRQRYIQDDFAGAKTLLLESRSISEGLGSAGQPSLAEAMAWLGLVWQAGDRDYTGAKAIFEQSLNLYQKQGDAWGIALASFHLGIVEGDLGNLEASRSLLEGSLATFQRFGDLFFMERVSLFLGYLFMKFGNDGKARLYFEKQLRLDEQIKFWFGLAEAWTNLGNFHLHRGEYEAAAQCYSHSLEVCSKHGLEFITPWYNSGWLALYLGDTSLAYQSFIHLFKLAQNTGTWRRVSLISLAAVAAQMGEPERAARLHGAAQAVPDVYVIRIPPDDQAEFDRQIEVARRQLGEARFQALEAEGSKMNLEQVDVYALPGK